MPKKRDRDFHFKIGTLNSTFIQLKNVNLTATLVHIPYGAFIITMGINHFFLLVKKLFLMKMIYYLIAAIILFILTIDYVGTRLIVQTKGGITSLIVSQGHKTQTDPEDLGLKFEDISVTSNDQLLLKGLIVKSNTPEQKGTIILVHGIRGNKSHFYHLAKQLADSSYNSVLIDLRAHGESEGKYCTYGFHEKEDIKLWVNSIIERSDISHNIGIWGQSLGGAVALQAMSVCSDIKYGIIESTFSDFEQIVHDYFKYHVGFDIPFLSSYLTWRTESITDFKPKEVKPYLSAQQVNQAIILVHGNKDKRINITYGKKNFKNLASQDKAFIEIEGAGHTNVWRLGGNNYFNTVFNFLNRQAVK